MHIEDLEDQLTVKPPPDGSPAGRHEALCHLCPWTYFRDTEEDARSYLRSHIIDAHLSPSSHELEERILDYVRSTGSPVRVADLSEMAGPSVLNLQMAVTALINYRMIVSEDHDPKRPFNEWKLSLPVE